jgi:hypothetical protein
MIILDKYILRQTIHIILDVFSLATIVALLSMFPFNFNIIPNTDIAYWISISVIASLIIAAVGLGIDTLVKLIILVVNIVEGRV